MYGDTARDEKSSCVCGRMIIIIRERDNSFSSASVFLRKLTENISRRKYGYELRLHSAAVLPFVEIPFFIV